jgi:transcription antitermination protein NusB
MGARTKARKRAVDILFEAEQRGLDPQVLLADRVIEPHTEAAVPQYTADLVEGVVAQRERIDELLATYSHGWTRTQARSGYSNPLPLLPPLARIDRPCDHRG